LRDSLLVGEREMCSSRAKGEDSPTKKSRESSVEGLQDSDILIKDKSMNNISISRKGEAQLILGGEKDSHFTWKERRSFNEKKKGQGAARLSAEGGAAPRYEWGSG